MRRNVIPINANDHFADYAEFRVLDDSERFARTSPRTWTWRPLLALFCKITFSIATWVLILLLAGGAVWLFGSMVVSEVIQKIQ